MPSIRFDDRWSGRAAAEQEMLALTAGGVLPLAAEPRVPFVDRWWRTNASNIPC